MAANDNNSLIFNCVVTDGMGMYSELDFPNHPKWPAKMHAGSLNATIDRSGFPAALEKIKHDGYGVQKLDSKTFAPLFTIKQEDIGNNSLGPTSYTPERGTAQIWACHVSAPSASIEFNAWAVRRIGSAYSNVIEIMSDKHLRKTYGLKNDMPIIVKLYAGEQDGTAEQQQPAQTGWRAKLKNILG